MVSLILQNGPMGEFKSRWAYWLTLIRLLSPVLVIISLCFGLFGCSKSDNPTPPSREFGTVQITVEPNGIDAPWTLTGPNDFIQLDRGDTTLEDMDAGDYVLAWEAVTDWMTPSPAQISKTLSNGGSITFSGTYLALTGTITIIPEPTSIDAPWTLSGPDGFSQAGTGEAVLSNLVAGEYVVTWQGVFGYTAPLPETRTLVGLGQVTFQGSYTPAVGWVSQDSGTTVDLWGVSFSDANTGTVVGDHGTILRTTDGGITWQRQTSGTTQYLGSVCFSDANTGTVVGDNGTILRTTNGGATWEHQTSGTSTLLRDVSFSDAETGVALGHKALILRTTNGGATWTGHYPFLEFPPRDQSPWLLGVFLTEAKTGAIVGDYGIILRTADGGTTWAQVAGGEWYSLLDVVFTDANTGIGLGTNDGTLPGNKIVRTTDGGATWESQSIGSELFFTTISFTDMNNGTVAGFWGAIMRTRDGGVTWNNQTSGTSNFLNDIYFTDSNTGTVVGNGGTILRTADGGGQ